MDLSFEDTRVAFAGKTDLELRKAQLLFASFGSSWVVQRGSAIASTLLRLRMPGVAPAIRSTVFAQFCGGESITECEATMAYLGRGGVKAILDYSVEGEKTEAGFDATLRETLATVEWAHTHPLIAFAVFKVTGLGRHALLQKRSGGGALSHIEEAEWHQVEQRVAQICERAHDLGVPVFLDAEETWIQGAIDALADDMMVRFNRDKAIVYNTWQIYRRDALARLEAATERAIAGGYHLGAKLVRGAYLEKERRRAAELGYPDPIQPDKAATDADYDRAVRLCVERLDTVALCAGTHNEPEQPAAGPGDGAVRRGTERPEGFLQSAPGDERQHLLQPGAGRLQRGQVRPLRTGPLGPSLSRPPGAGKQRHRRAGESRASSHRARAAKAPARSGALRVGRRGPGRVAPGRR